MHVPKKHMVENVEKALKEEEHACAPTPMPGVKSVVNIGAPQDPHRGPTRKKVAPPKKEKPKGKKKSRMAGKMEDALSGMY